ncbi:MAG: hypothetical protein OEV93_02535 [Candidatus Moranbacteria bacterium]|nr:hypothetical protein [Candidatus Moranbacteria bacterium]
MCNYPAVPCSPLWWLETDFGVLIFILFFLTWGLLLVTLVLHVLYLVRKLSLGGDKTPPIKPLKKRK